MRRGGKHIREYVSSASKGRREERRGQRGRKISHLAAVAVGGGLSSHPMHATEFALTITHDLQRIAARTAYKAFEVT